LLPELRLLGYEQVTSPYWQVIHSLASVKVSVPWEDVVGRVAGQA